MHFTPVEQQAIDFIDSKSLIRLKEAGFSIVRSGEQIELGEFDQWQVGYDADYADVLDYRVYAGYIFQDTGEDFRRIDVPDEDDARQIVNWLNERDVLLAVRDELIIGA